jgi:hypothetical protein
VWRMCVCGMETVMIMRRGGLGDGGASGMSVVVETDVFESRMTLCF